MDENDRKNSKSQIRDYVKLCGFLSRLISFKVPRLEKLFAFAGFMVKKLPAEGKPPPTEILNMTDLDNYRRPTSRPPRSSSSEATVIR